MNTDQPQARAATSSQTPGLFMITLSKLVADKFGIDESYLQVPYSIKTRKREVIDARFFIQSYISCVMKHGPTHTGTYVGMDHASITHSTKVFSDRLFSDKKYQRTVKDILIEIKIGKEIGSLQLPKLNKLSKRKNMKPFDLVMDESGRVRP